MVDAQLVHQCQVLEDRLDAVLASVLDRAQPDLLALYEDATVVGLVEPRQDLDQRGLAGAVVADEAEDLAPAKVHIHAPQCRYRAEAHRDVLDPQHVLGVGPILGLDVGHHRRTATFRRRPNTKVRARANDPCPAPLMVALSIWTLRIMATRMAIPRMRS